jgi:hypothetical protein
MMANLPEQLILPARSAKIPRRQYKQKACTDFCVFHQPSGRIGMLHRQLMKDSIYPIKHAHSDR